MTQLHSINTDLTYAHGSSIEKLESMLEKARNEGLDWVVIVAGKGPNYLHVNSFIPDYLTVLGALSRAQHLLQRKLDEGL